MRMQVRLPEVNPEVYPEADACPFNALYWHFLQRNQAQLGQNPRLSLAYANWHKRSDNDKAAILAKAADTLIKLEQL